MTPKWSTFITMLTYIQNSSHATKIDATRALRNCLEHGHRAVGKRISSGRMVIMVLLFRGLKFLSLLYFVFSCNLWKISNVIKCFNCIEFLVTR